jgi:uncharacterized membrane protein
VKKDIIYLSFLFIILSVMFRIIFFSESFLVILRLVASIFWLFIIPGFAIMFYWHDRLDFLARLLLGAGLSAAMLGILSYYFGLAGIHIKYHFVFIPALLLVVAVFFVWGKVSSHESVKE